MYRIQAFNHAHNHWTVIWAHSMEERNDIIKGLLDSGEYRHANITIEWLARKGY